MKIYSYIRVSTQNQSYESQKFEIDRFCNSQDMNVDVWITETASGTLRPQDRKLGRLIRKMQPGDMLLCTEISRLGRNMLMIMGVLNECAQRQIRIRTIKDRFDLSDSINSKIIAFAFALASEIERNLISQRTREALAAKKAEGVRLGRPPGPSCTYRTYLKNADRVMLMLDEGKSVSEIARMLDMHRNTLARYIRSEKVNIHK